METATQFIDQRNELVFDKATALLLATQTEVGRGGEAVGLTDLYLGEDGVYFEFMRGNTNLPDEARALPAAAAWMMYRPPFGDSNEDYVTERKVEVEFPEYATRDTDFGIEEWLAKKNVLWPVLRYVLGGTRYPQDAAQLRRLWRMLDEAIVMAEFPTTEESIASQEVDTREAVLA